MSHKHNFDEQKKIVNRLAKAIGHLEKVKRMVEAGEDLIRQLTSL